MMLQKSVERLSALVKVHSGLVRMPRPRAGSHRLLARTLP